ncbi:unnamed protein product [Cuscuta campestris]|uniref:Topo IIA-type catalytic domain-containing protein n=1 Tax=Cuscuta campestris TaxID=132261 RepID=A0A484N0A6_9ASTE|nr:unnamed protein product [Cuscuta campestris]
MASDQALIEGMLLSDIDQNTVHFVPNFDNSETEPSLLPARIPNLLLNGASGIALQELLEHMPGPDFPTGGIIMGSIGPQIPPRLAAGASTISPRTARPRAVNGNVIVADAAVCYGLMDEAILGRNWSDLRIFRKSGLNGSRGEFLLARDFVRTPEPVSFSVHLLHLFRRRIFIFSISCFSGRASASYSSSETDW